MIEEKNNYKYFKNLYKKKINFVDGGSSKLTNKDRNKRLKDKIVNQFKLFDDNELNKIDNNKYLDFINRVTEFSNSTIKTIDTFEFEERWDVKEKKQLLLTEYKKLIRVNFIEPAQKIKEEVQEEEKFIILELFIFVLEELLEKNEIDLPFLYDLSLQERMGDIIELDKYNKLVTDIIHSGNYDSIDIKQKYLNALNHLIETNSEGSDKVKTANANANNSEIADIGNNNTKNQDVTKAQEAQSEAKAKEKLINILYSNIEHDILYYEKINKLKENIIQKQISDEKEKLKLGIYFKERELIILNKQRDYLLEEIKKNIEIIKTDQNNEHRQNYVRAAINILLKYKEKFFEINKKVLDETENYEILDFLLLCDTHEISLQSNKEQNISFNNPLEILRAFKDEYNIDNDDNNNIYYIIYTNLNKIKNKQEDDSEEINLKIDPLLISFIQKYADKLEIIINNYNEQSFEALAIFIRESTILRTSLEEKLLRKELNVLSNNISSNNPDFESLKNKLNLIRNKKTSFEKFLDDKAIDKSEYNLDEVQKELDEVQNKLDEVQKTLEKRKKNNDSDSDSDSDSDNDNEDDSDSDSDSDKTKRKLSQVKVKVKDVHDLIKNVTKDEVKENDNTYYTKVNNNDSKIGESDDNNIYNDHDDEKKDRIGELAELEKELAELKQKILAETDKLAQQLTEREKLVQQLEEATEKNKNLEKELPELEKAEKEEIVQQLEKQQKFKKELAKLVQQFAEKNKKILAKRAKLAELEKIVQQLEKNKKILTELAKLEEEATEKDKKILTKRAKLAELEKIVQQLEKNKKILTELEKLEEEATEKDKKILTELEKKKLKKGEDDEDEDEGILLSSDIIVDLDTSNTNVNTHNNHGPPPGLGPLPYFGPPPGPGPYSGPLPYFGPPPGPGPNNSGTGSGSGSGSGSSSDSDSSAWKNCNLWLILFSVMILIFFILMIVYITLKNKAHIKDKKILQANMILFGILSFIFLILYLLCIL